MAPIIYSRGASITDNYPQRRTAQDFDAFTVEIAADRSPNKGGPYIASEFNGDGRRCAEGAKPRRWMTLDLDWVAPEVEAAVRQWLARFNAAAWRTHSASDAHPKLRVIFELDRAASDAECRHIGALLSAKLEAEFPGKVKSDPRVWPLAQPNYCPPTDAEVHRFTGKPLPVDECMAQAIPAPTTGESEDASQAQQINAGSIRKRSAPLPLLEGFDDAPADLREALRYADCDDRASWLAVLAALKADPRGDRRELGRDWSSQSDKFNAEDFDRVWDSIKPPYRTNVGAIFKAVGMAKPQNPTHPTEGMTAETGDASAPQKKTRAALVEWPDAFKPRPVAWAIKNILERNAVGVLWAEPDAFKSFVALDWALSLAYGMPWLGQYAVVGAACDVVLIVGEGRAGLERRIAAWQAEHGVPVGENAGRRIGISRGAIELNDANGANVAALITQIRAASKSPGLIVVDTLARNSSGNENQTEDMNRLMRLLDVLRDAFPGAIVLIVHHANKEGAMRGSMVVPGACDFIYRIERRKAAMEVDLISEKMKDAAKPDPIRLIAEVVDLGTEPDENGFPEPITSLVMRPAPKVEEAKEPTMEEQVIQAVRRLRKDGGVSANRICEEIGANRKEVLGTIREMVDAGTLTRTKDGVKVSEDAYLD